MTQEHRELLAKCFSLSPGYVQRIFIKEHGLDYKEIWQVIQELPLSSTRRTRYKMGNVIKSLAIEAQHGGCFVCSKPLSVYNTMYLTATGNVLCAHCNHKAKRSNNNGR